MSGATTISNREGNGSRHSSGTPSAGCCRPSTIVVSLGQVVGSQWTGCSIGGYRAWHGLVHNNVSFGAEVRLKCGRSIARWQLPKVRPRPITLAIAIKRCDVVRGLSERCPSKPFAGPNTRCWGWRLSRDCLSPEAGSASVRSGAADGGTTCSLSVPWTTCIRGLAGIRRGCRRRMLG